MTIQKAEDIKDIALKLDEIRTHCPEDYFYLKGWIHCLLQKESITNSQQSKAPQQANSQRKKHEPPVA